MNFQAANIIDLVCVVLMLVFGIAGAKKGFVRYVLGAISVIAALILAFAFAKAVSGLAESVFGLTSSASAWVEKTLLKREGFAVDVSGEGIAAAALENVNLPSFVKDAVVKQLSGMNDYPAGTTLASVVAPVFANFIVLLGSWLVVFLASVIVLKLIAKLLNGLAQKIPLVSALNRLLGFVVGALKILLIVCGVLAVLSLIPGGISEKMGNFFEQTIILKYLYNDNPLNKLLGLLIK